VTDPAQVASGEALHARVAGGGFGVTVDTEGSGSAAG
jgi:exodeoxyribonuclease VII large subunit